MPSLPSSLSLSGWPVDGSQAVAATGRGDLAAIQTAVNALIAAESGGTAGQFLTATSSTAVAWAGAYTTYTPTWTASGTAPAIGNAVTVARYLQVGKLVHCYGQITFGTTTTFGTGQYTFALPLTAASAIHNAGHAELFDTSASNYILATGSLTSTTLMQFLYPATYGGLISQAGQLTPWTWATGDFIAWNITYEVA